MMMFVKKLWAIVSSVWRCVALFLSFILKRKGGSSSSSSTPPANEDVPEWKSEEWEDFSVSVIPNPELSTAPPGVEETSDVFSDMQPVIKKAKKVTGSSPTG
jgi:hypothetical protein